MNSAFHIIARRFLRAAVNSATLLSALLCIATAALWIRSLFATDYYSRTSRNLYQAASGDGGICLQIISFVRRSNQWTPFTTMPSGRPAPLSKYTQTQGNYSQWKAAKIPPPGWTSSPSKNWQGLVIGSTRFSHWPAFSTIPYLRFQNQHFRDRKTNDGLKHESMTDEEWMITHRLWIPYWLLLTLAAILPLIRIIRWNRHRRQILIGHCPICGYDLRASAHRCPECGTPIHPPPTPQSPPEAATSTASSLPPPIQSQHPPQPQAATASPAPPEDDRCDA
jgi:hypothetical protein